MPYSPDEWMPYPLDEWIPYPLDEWMPYPLNEWKLYPLNEWKLYSLAKYISYSPQTWTFSGSEGEKQVFGEVNAMLFHHFSPHFSISQNVRKTRHFATYWQKEWMRQSYFTTGRKAASFLPFSFPLHFLFVILHTVLRHSASDGICALPTANHD